MLNHISIHNFVLIKQIHIDLSDQFNVFTGETGAGKSLLVDALNFAGGERSSAKIVGKNDTKARVEISFTFSEDALVNKKLKALDLYEPNEDLIIVREMSDEGRNVCRINGRMVNLSTVRDVLDGVLDVHSQHETQYLLNPKNHRMLLDHYAKINFEAYAQAYALYREKNTAYQAMIDSDFNPDEIAFAQFQLEEINAINPSLEDFDTTESRLALLKNFEKFKSVYNASEKSLNYEPGIVSALYDVTQLLKGLNDATIYEKFNDVYLQLEDLRDELVSENDSLNFDQYEFDALQARLVSYASLRRKYGSIERCLEKKNALELQIDQSSNYDDFLMDAKLEFENAEKNLLLEAEHLSSIRKKAAKKLQSEVLKQLSDLMLSEAQFEIRFDQKSPDSGGFDSVVFCVSMNKGMTPEPMNTVASGGELSRLMLGLKVIFSKLYGISTLVFDEIDTGVSGRIGLMMGSKMKDLSKQSQVLTITHLPSVAACADHHYSISKDHQDKATITSVERVEGQQRLEQLALIMSGIISEASISAAQELLEEGQAI